MNHGSLFSGIGGFDLAAEWMGWNNIFHCEWNEFGKKVLHHYWPNAIQYHDITKTDFTIHRGRIDILTGGFPCQPYSSAGKRLGKDDERHLWPEMLRAIREIQPRWIVGENVLGLTNWNGGLVFHEVQVDLEAAGYEVQPFVLPACAVNAPHRRDRVWFVAYRNSIRLEHTAEGGNIQSRTGKAQSKGSEFAEPIETNGGNGDATNTKVPGGEGERKCESGEIQSNGRGSQAVSTVFNNFPTQSPICGGDDGLPRELDGITFSKWRAESIKAYGNAVVPQVVFQIFKAIEQYQTL